MRGPLKISDIGRIVVFVGKNIDGTIYSKELGVIKHFNNKGKVAWIVYSCANKWHKFREYTAASTKYSDLHLTNQNIDTVGIPKF